jgi:hypothetical protein
MKGDGSKFRTRWNRRRGVARRCSSWNSRQASREPPAPTASRPGPRVSIAETLRRRVRHPRRNSYRYSPLTLVRSALIDKFPVIPLYRDLAGFHRLRSVLMQPYPLGIGGSGWRVHASARGVRASRGRRFILRPAPQLRPHVPFSVAATWTFSIAERMSAYVPRGLQEALGEGAYQKL